jgi:diaminopimelate decarboxylase
VQAALDGLDRLPTRVPVQSWLSFKTHPLSILASQWIETGRGVEVVSDRELTVLRTLECPVDQLLVNGVAKHEWLGRHEIRRLRVHFDSLREVDRLLPAALRYQWRTGVRVHAPDERDAREPDFGGQFGMSPGEAVQALRRLRDAGAAVESVHFHLGQSHHDPEAYSRGVDRLADVCAEAGVDPLFVDCGGGLPPAHDPAALPALDGLAQAAARAADRFPQLREIWVENGRYVTEAASALAVSVIDIKDRPECRYLICDGGRTNHALAADSRPHPLLLLPQREGAGRLTTICGPTCMTDDRLGRWQLPESVAVGDVIVWLDAGAYHLPWETRFSHGLCPVVWFDRDEQLTVARSRESVESWVAL